MAEILSGVRNVGLSVEVLLSQSAVHGHSPTNMWTVLSRTYRVITHEVRVKRGICGGFRCIDVEYPDTTCRYYRRYKVAEILCY